MRVEVTADDIARGEAKCQSRCPVALALGRALPGRGFVKVGLSTATVGGRLLILPAEAICAIGAFDRGDPIEAFSFEIDFVYEEKR